MSFVLNKLLPPTLSVSEKKELVVKSQERFLPYLRLCLFLSLLESSTRLVLLYLDTEYFNLSSAYSIVTMHDFLLFVLSYVPGIKKVTNIFVGGLIVSSVFILGVIQPQIGMPFELYWISFFIPMLLIPLIPSFLTAFCTLWLMSWLIFQFAATNDISTVNLIHIRYCLIHYGIMILVISYVASIYRINSYLLEKKLEEAKNDANSANEAKSQFLATVSHEVRTPLGGVLGIIGLLKDTPLDAKQKDYIETIKYSSEALLTILNDILDYSKIESGKFDLEYINFNLQRLIQSVITLMHSRIDEKRLDLHCHIDKNIPAHLKSDPTRIRQILLNLITNAIKFTDKGSITLSIKYKTKTDGDANIYFGVKDTGIGLSKEDQEKLFQEYSQTDASISRKYGGTGLGLSICKNLAELMGGKIGVKSTEGQGSTFWFRIPFIAVDEIGKDDMDSDIEEQEQLKTTPLNILVVEDNQLNQQIIQGILEKANHVITIADNGKQALDILSQSDDHKFDLILMDMQMPVMDGLEATKKIRQLENTNSQLTIIALTANTIEEDQQKCIEAGMNSFITKPIRPLDLFEAINNYKVIQ